MKNNLRNSYRMAGYALLAIGLINWRYQSGSQGVLTKSLTLIIPGVVLIASTFVPGLASSLEKRGTSFVVWALVLAFVVYSFVI